jgi:hypothetical protein
LAEVIGLGAKPLAQTIFCIVAEAVEARFLGALIALSSAQGFLNWTANKRGRKKRFKIKVNS